jgi:uncharacterized membrane protein
MLFGLFRRARPDRYPEIDFARTLAVVMMVIYHAAYDLAAFYGWNFDPLAGGWWLFARTTAVLFLLIVGVSFSVSWERSGSDRMKFVKRGLFILAWGMTITLVTYLFDPPTYVRFGILHLIGVSVMLLPFVAPLRSANFALGVLVILCGALLDQRTVATSLLLPLGLMPPSFRSIDYFPLLPWFGVILIGAAIGHFLYAQHPQWRLRFNIQHSIFNIHILSFPGRHALSIYLLHQPLILAILWLFLGRPLH